MNAQNSIVYNNTKCIKTDIPSLQELYCKYKIIFYNVWHKVAQKVQLQNHIQFSPQNQCLWAKT